MEQPSTAHRNAIAYALRELGRRAGASAAFIDGWRVSFAPGSVTLYPAPDSGAKIVFRHDASKSVRFSQVRYAVARYTPGVPISSVPDAVVLFDDEADVDLPLFRRTGAEALECAGDILTSALWTLARLEEIASVEADEHGRFPAAASAAFNAGCLDRPIVDEYGLVLQKVFSQLLPRWRPEPRDLRVKLSHDIDLAGVPFRLKTTLGHLYPRNIPGAFADDILALAKLSLPAYLKAVLHTAEISRARGFTSAFYWQTSVQSFWDAGYDISQPLIRRVIEQLDAGGCELGFHPGYGTFGSLQRLRDEVVRLRSVIGCRPIGGRQHYLRWSPQTWKHWEDAGLAYDSTVGFADAIGFRAGTCIPYRPWLFDEARESSILEIPLIVMDCTPVRYMHLSQEQTLDSIRALIARCRSVGGVFTLLWHNVSVIERPYAALYPRILDMLGNACDYNWLSDRVLGDMKPEFVVG